jgi:hypothetical protein
VLIRGGNVVIFDRFPQAIAHFLANQKKKSLYFIAVHTYTLIKVK